MNEDFEIKEPEEYYGTKGESFSYSQLVMAAARKYIENSSKEMREGYWNVKFDKFGNAHRVYIPDARNELIESVNTFCGVLEREYDKEAEKQIEELKTNLEERYKTLLKREEDEWKNLHYARKDSLIKEGYYPREGYLSKCFPYFSEYIEEKLITYRKIASELFKLIKRNGDFQEEMFEA
jgi:hypothetical protein